MSAIESGHVAGAALDVFEEEPAQEDNPLFARDEVIATPHLGASTVEAQENVAVQIAEQMAEYLLTGTVLNAVNTPSVAPEDMAKLGPYLTLAQQIGNFAGQIAAGRIHGVTVAYEGQASALDSRLLTAAAPAGSACPAPRRHQYCQRPLHRPRARHHGARSPERDDGGLPDPLAGGSAVARARADGGRHAHRQGRAANRGNRGHRNRGRAWPPTCCISATKTGRV